ncbi:IclR family transcriptional regulator [Streptomyces pseudovenezuelae]|uniref:IclR family transcriptional regulator n=1 Tax=Streptomyces pseudovenezuelae TaxID=67350 RepID=UPI002E37765E|nr:IclR family transcriptional regulator [Streptomyces pseudovenezuelae]
MSIPSTTPDRSVVERTLSVLGAFDTGNVRLTVSEISRRTGIPVATAYRIVSKLLSWGALERAEDNRYTIGLRLWEIALLAPRHSAFRAAAVPHMVELRALTRSAVLLSVREGDEGICLESVSGSARPLRRSWSRGHRFPLHATACGRVLLAGADAATWERIRAAGLDTHTARTVTDPAALRDLVTRARRQGFAVADGELLEGVVEVAAPVHDGDGVAVGAVGLVADGGGIAQVRRLTGPLLTAAVRISRSLAAPARTEGRHHSFTDNLRSRT